MIATTMQSLNDDERREVLGEVLADELKVIHEYVQDIPLIKQKLAEVDQRLIRVEDRLVVVEAVTRAHEAVTRAHSADIKYLMRQLS